MDASLYCDLVVKRGLTYRYYRSPAAQGMPTLLFLHGFPSTAYDWHKQIAYLQPLGYGIIAPDLLGAGGTAKPLDPKAFRMNAMARDVMDILAAEGVDKVIGISHDWGSALLSRLVMLYSEAFLAYAWVAVPFLEPFMAHFDLEEAMAYAKKTLGYESYAYWQFLLREDAHTVVHQHVDSFMQLGYPENPDAWRDYICQRGGMAKCVEDGVLLGRPSYLDDQAYNTLRETLLANGIQSSANWYRAQIEDVDVEDNLKIPKEAWKLKSPSLMVRAMKDYVCTPQGAKASMEKYGADVEFLDVESGHWPHLEHADTVNTALRRWLESRSL